MNSLVLAFVGDAVHTLFIRKHFATDSFSAGNLHKLCSDYCKASAQSEALKKIENILNDEEKEVVRKARNTKTHDAPKNAKLVDYKRATSFEALIGYLYLKNDITRLEYILNLSILNWHFLSKMLFDIYDDNLIMKGVKMLEYYKKESTIEEINKLLSETSKVVLSLPKEYFTSADMEQEIEK